MLFEILKLKFQLAMADITFTLVLIGLVLFIPMIYIPIRNRFRK